MAENIKYRIMVVAARKEENKSLYKYLLDKNKEIYEATSIDEIDAKVEEMLNNEGYSKNDFIVINEVEFNVLASIVGNTELREEETETPEMPDTPEVPEEPEIPVDPEDPEGNEGNEGNEPENNESNGTDTDNTEGDNTENGNTEGSEAGDGENSGNVDEGSTETGTPNEEGTDPEEIA